jgi:hypothetical protein
MLPKLSLMNDATKLVTCLHGKGYVGQDFQAGCRKNGHTFPSDRRSRGSNWGVIWSHNSGGRYGAVAATVGVRPLLSGAMTGVAKANCKVKVKVSKCLRPSWRHRGKDSDPPGKEMIR